jgi:DNA-binding NtrC family response regulator
MTPDPEKPLNALIVQDDPVALLGCEQAMQLAGITVMTARSAEEARAMIEPGLPGVLVTDMRLPGMDGLQFLRMAREIDAELPVIVITGHDDLRPASEAMRSGAYDVIEKPFSPVHLVNAVKRSLEKRALTNEVAALRQRLERREDIESRLIGNSPEIEKVRRLILDVADADIDVLVVGETGTGKETAARCLHDFSRRHMLNYVSLSCEGLPDSLLDSELFGDEPGASAGAPKRRFGKIEQANGGTLLLGEIESVSIEMQAKLLHVLQERAIERPGSNAPIPVTCRVIAATKDNLKALAAQHKFRTDLYYRLNVVTIELPPLRERREDLPMLYNHFLLQAAKRYDRPVPLVPADLIRALMAHDWPGNLRELRNVAECQALGVPREAVSTGAPRSPGLSLTESVAGYERALITAELARQAGNVARTSEALGVARTTLHDKLRKYGLG